MADSHIYVPPAVRIWGAASIIICTALAATLLRAPAPLLLWNASSSSTVGLYAVSGRAPNRGDMAIAWAPLPARLTAAERGYLPFKVPLVKRVAAVAGDEVCAAHNRIRINGRPVAARRTRDPSGRAMPSWSGCVRLQSGELFLLSVDTPLAFDGRYFGMTRPGEVVGTARLLWAKPVQGSAHG